MVALALLAAASIAERFAYMGSRTTLFSVLLQSPDQCSTGAAAAMTKLTVLAGLTTMVASFVGAALVLGVGPRVTAGVGAALAALGYVVVAAGGPLLLGSTVVATGAGIFRVCPYAAAAELFSPAPSDRAEPPSPTRFAMMSAFAVLIYAGASASAGVAPVAGGALFTYGDKASAYGAYAAVAALAALLASAAVLVERLAVPGARPLEPSALPYRAPAAMPRPASPSVEHAQSSLAGVTLLASAFALWQVAARAGATTTGLGAAPMDVIRRLHTLGTIATTLAALCLGGLLVVAVLARWTLRPVAIFGGGLAVTGLAVLVKSASETSLAAFAVGELTASVADASLSIGVAYAALGVPGRRSAFVIAGWLALAYLASSVGGAVANALDAYSFRAALGVGAGLGCIAAGGATVVLRRRLHALWHAPATDRPATP